MNLNTQFSYFFLLIFYMILSLYFDLLKYFNIFSLFVCFSSECNSSVDVDDGEFDDEWRRSE